MSVVPPVVAVVAFVVFVALFATAADSVVVVDFFVLVAVVS